jgi:phosphoinositide-3-kinase regulatory subunit 4
MKCKEFKCDDVYCSDRCAPCRLELQQLAYRKQELHTVAVRSKEWAEQVAWKPLLPPPNWRLRGLLVAHLHEHRGAISRYVIVGIRAEGPDYHGVLKITLEK